MLTSYNCHTCQEPMRITMGFHAYIASSGPTQQRCQHCSAVHTLTWNGQTRMMSVALTEPGKDMAQLSDTFPYPAFKPYRTGPYRVQFAGSKNWAKDYWVWNGEHFHNGPMIMSEASICAWQGLAGNMEHLKSIPEPRRDPLPDVAYLEGEDGE